MHNSVRSIYVVSSFSTWSSGEGEPFFIFANANEPYLCFQLCNYLDKILIIFRNGRQIPCAIRKPVMEGNFLLLKSSLCYRQKALLQRDKRWHYAFYFLLESSLKHPSNFPLFRHSLLDCLQISLLQSSKKVLSFNLLAHCFQKSCGCRMAFQKLFQHLMRRKLN